MRIEEMSLLRELREERERREAPAIEEVAMVSEGLW